MHQFREVSPAWFIDASRWFIHQQNIRSAYQGKATRLIAAAIEAVQQWKYEATLINGRAVPVILTATVNFSLRRQ